MDYNIVKVESQLLCIAFAIVFLKFSPDSFEKKSHKIYLAGCLSLVASIAEIIRILCAKSSSLSHISCIVYFSVFSIIEYLWTNYCFDEFKINNKALKFLTVIPAASVIIPVLISFNTGWVYYIDEYGKLYCGEGYYILLINYLYVVFGVCFGLYVAQKSENKRKGNECIKISLCSLPTLLGAAQITVFPEGISVASFTVLLSLFILHGILQKKKTVTDNLTELPNRYGMDEEIEEQLKQYKRDKEDSFYIIVCDLDNFKTINDSWGHPEGDRALKLIAESLENVSLSYNSEVFRIGGDEFVIITDTSESGLAKQICNAVKKSLDDIDFRDDFDIRMSMGVALYDGTCSVTELISGADKKLYQAKKNKKQQGDGSHQ